MAVYRPGFLSVLAWMGFLLLPLPPAVSLQKGALCWDDVTGLGVDLII